MSSAFSDLGFSSYDATPGALCNVGRLVICLNSLLRILEPADENGFCKINSFDLLVLDEIDSLARWLGGALLDDNSAIHACLKVLVTNATYVVCMDGLPSPAINYLLESFEMVHDFHWMVFSSFRFREVVFCNNTAYYLKCFMEALERGENLFFVSNSKTVVTRLKDLCLKKIGLPECDVMAIYGDMSEVDRSVSGNPETWTRYRVVLANTSLGPGVSFDHPGHFSRVFFIAKASMGVTPADIAQLVGRVRFPMQKTVIGMVLKKKFNVDARNVTAASILAKRQRTIASYASGLVTSLGPIRLAKKIEEARKEREQQELRLRALGRHTNRPANANPNLYQPTITVVPTFVEGELRGEPRPLAFGLTFTPTPVGTLCSLIGALSSYWSADSEGFLRELEDIFTRSGSVCRHVGERTRLDQDGKDIVQANHYAFLDKIKKLADSKDYEHLNNDYFVSRWEGKMDPEAYDRVRSAIHNPMVTDSGSNLFRFCTIIRALEDPSILPHEAVRLAEDRDLRSRFEAPVGRHITGTSNSIRPAYLPRKGDLAHTPTSAELLQSFLDVITLLEYRYDPATKKLHSPNLDMRYCTNAYIQLDDPARQIWWDRVKRLCELRIRSSPSFEYVSARGLQVKKFMTTEAVPEHPEDHAMLFPILRHCMAWLGFPLIHTDFRRTIRVAGGSTKKTTCHSYQIDQHHYHLSLALIGFSALTGLEVGNEQALKDYQIYLEQNPPLPPKTRPSRR